MRIILFTIFFLFSARLLSQEEEDSTSFVAIKTHLVRSKMEKTDFFGISRNVKRLEVVAKTKVQTSCNGGVYGTWDTVSNVLYIYQTIDSIGNLRDSIYNRLKAYFHERLKNSKIPGDSNIFYNYPHGFIQHLQAIYLLSVVIMKAKVLGPFYTLRANYIKLSFLSAMDSVVCLHLLSKTFIWKQMAIWSSLKGN